MPKRKPKLTGDVLYQDAIQHIYTFLTDRDYFTAVVSVCHRWLQAVLSQRSRGSTYVSPDFVGKSLRQLLQSSLRFRVTRLELFPISANHMCVRLMTATSIAMPHLQSLQCSLKLSDDAVQPDVSFPMQLEELQIALMPASPDWYRGMYSTAYAAATGLTAVINGISKLHNTLKKLTISFDRLKCQAPHSLIELMQQLQQLHQLESCEVHSSYAALDNHHVSNWQFITELPKLQQLYWNQLRSEDIQYLSNYPKWAAQITKLNRGNFDTSFWPHVLSFTSIRRIEVPWKNDVRLELGRFIQLESLVIRCENVGDFNPLIMDLSQCIRLLEFTFICNDENLTSSILLEILTPLKTLTKLKLPCKRLTNVKFIAQLPHLHQQLKSLTIDSCYGMMEDVFLAGIVRLTALEEIVIHWCFVEPFSEAAKLSLTPTSPTRLPQLTHLKLFKFTERFFF